MSEVFVFGSNLAGIHGAGAAKYARMHYEAELGVGEGRTGNAYAIPTKDWHLKTLDDASIMTSIHKFFLYVKNHPQDTFLLTPIGCGLAGKRPEVIATMIRKYWTDDIKNVQLTKSWLEHV